MTHLRLASLAASLGTVDSLIQLSSAMNYSFLDRAAQQKMTITEGLMRYSTGIEDTDDVLDDFDQALKKI
jgi:cystathionine beta-lyase/cystathionine gamma-synthase